MRLSLESAAYIAKSFTKRNVRTPSGREEMILLIANRKYVVPSWTLEANNALLMCTLKVPCNTKFLIKILILPLKPSE